MDRIPANFSELDSKIKGFIQDMTRSGCEERAAIYTRVSRLDRRHHGYSMEIQPDRAEEYARSKGWEVFAIYEDPAKTGRNSRRPALQRMLVDIRAGRVTIVVVHRLDRLYRNLESLLKFIRIIKRYKVAWFAVTEQIDTDNWWGRLVLYVLGALAEMYIWQSSARTREAKLERVMNGLPNGFYRFGYCNGLCSSCTDPNGKDYCPFYGCRDRVESHAVEFRCCIQSKVMLYEWLHIFIMMEIAIWRSPVPSTAISFACRMVLLSSFARRACRKEPARRVQPGQYREIIRSPFYVGLIAHYPTRPLDMEDDPENPKNKNPPAIERPTYTAVDAARPA
jgi:DNA invertase Pin-like site-specific DNA recombinase